MTNVRLLDEARRRLRDSTPDDGPSRPRTPAGPPAARETPTYPVFTPRDVLPHPKDLDCLVAWDTETSGLFVDDGARTAIVSVAYILRSDPETVVSYAFPFDQCRAADKGLTVQRDKRGLPKGLEDPRDLDMWLWDENLTEADWEDLKRWLRLAGEHVGLVGHNDKYDLHMTHIGTRDCAGISLEPYVVWDSMLACANLWPRDSMALKPTMARLYGAEEGEEAAEVKQALETGRKLFGLTGDDGKRYDLLPWVVVGPYATKDAEQTLRLTKRQALEFYEEGNGDWNDIARAVDLMRVLYRMEWRGFGPLDVKRTSEVAAALQRRVEQLEAAMPYQPPTAYRAKEYYFDHLGLKPWKGAEEPRVWDDVPDPKTGELKRKLVKQGTLTIDVLKRMAAAGVPFAAESAELSRIRTANNMQYQGYVNLSSPRDQKMRTSYKQAFVRSGRMSVERWQGQAIPRRDSVRIESLPGFGEVPHPRDLFITPACVCGACNGKQVRRVTIDLSQAELRVAFKQANCVRGIEQIYAGRDIHGEMATQVFGVTKEDEEFKHYRYIAKRGVFGGIFMVGTKTFRDTIWNLAGIDLPWDEAKKTVYGFRELYPEIEVAYNESQAMAERDGFVVLQDGTKSYFGPRDFPNTAWNRRVQGSLALFNAEWLIEAERRSEHMHDGNGALVLTIHDSVTLDLEPDTADEWIEDFRNWTNVHFEKTFGIVGACDLDEGF